ncbi:sugar phosphate isomerase/epimerase family protein [Bacillus timonensis]|uniref:sugar phosphate isomerase/epimerase family protein n=1 Tax=Bacillus timonensis TaxID=1033734 RepID=UPI000289D67C|nr:sugar phosphate isomerase/epimerase family protein [Bacillus timonensis]
MEDTIKISVFPKGFIDDLSTGKMTVFEWIEQAGTLGADGLEMYPTFLQSTDRNYLEKVKEAATSVNLTIPMMCASPDFTHHDPAFRENEVNKIKEMIDVMAFLGPEEFRSCRVLSGQRRPEVSREEGIKWTQDCIKELLAYAESKRVYLVMENHYKDGFWIYPEFAQKSDIYLEIIEGISSNWFGVNFDPSNAVFAGDDPLELLEKVKDRLITMHASDRYIKDGYTMKDIESHLVQGYSDALAHGVIGKGIIDYDRIFQLLASIHFTGWISIEDGVNGLEEMKESVEFLKRKVNEYR